MKATLLLFSLAGGVLSSCASESNEPTPEGITHHLKARVTGRDLGGLQAAFQIEEVRDYYTQGARKRLLTEHFSSSISNTYDLGTYGPADKVEATVGFTNVMASSGPAIGASTSLKLELMADGKVIASAELNQAKRGANVYFGPHLTGYTAIETDNL
ncbi:hypothetical protein [Hymenobacter swuensis]|uniref:Uncharacterized protein n=1 Tax=Hymenobacter swuensis DY53 TaxID=1227739 RepID=W8F0P5_9BACT|nr:hypothetical protein [Hymenobacter swuensis]AHJ95410.1 hypothetical protein Hsw_PA0077 [Hymenobacter swuensis DY53]